MLKPHIGIFGRRNVGKSSLINVLAGQDISIVSEHAGTTTDPVKKLMEIDGIGPTLFIDTAGVDDVGELGELRIRKSLETIEEINLGIIVLAENIITNFEIAVIEKIKQYKTPYLIVHHKEDLIPLDSSFKNKILNDFEVDIIPFSSTTYEKSKVDILVQRIAESMPKTALNTPSILGDLVRPKDVVLMVTPIDSEAPQGRMILPQMQALRDALDHDCIVVMLKETELQDYFDKVGFKPALVVTDSQAFHFVNSIVPNNIPLTGFSILFARLKGDWRSYFAGTRAIGRLDDGDRVLIYESCSHHVLEDDIGRVKIPNWITNTTNKNIKFEVVAGKDHPKYGVDEYSLVIQCGGCMMTRKQVLNRMQVFTDHDIPITNYGMAIAYCNGIFERATECFS